jgi:hypothetical protein
VHVTHIPLISLEAPTGEVFEVEPSIEGVEKFVRAHSDFFSARDFVPLRSEWMQRVKRPAVVQYLHEVCTGRLLSYSGWFRVGEREKAQERIHAGRAYHKRYACVFFGSRAARAAARRESCPDLSIREMEERRKQLREAAKA